MNPDDFIWHPSTSVNKALETYEKVRAEDLRRQQHQERRDRFAAAALEGLLSNSTRGGKFEYFARDAVRFADAMIKELDKQETPR